MKNEALARRLLASLAKRGVREVVLCAGARNAPFVRGLGLAEGVTTFSFFEERSASFFALGRIRDDGRPIAVITTSGTAVAECLPAVIEADLQSLPLIVVSADRPRRYRGSGAPQTIAQPGLFGSYVEASLDFEGEFEDASLDGWSGRRPLHLNACFDEPLLDGDGDAWTWPADASPSAVASAAAAGRESSWPVTFDARRPLVVVGPLRPEEAIQIKPHLLRWRRPLLLESPSQLRGDPDLAELELVGGDVGRVEHDGIVRVGGVPTARFWRELEKSGRPVLHYSRVPLPGLPGNAVVHPLAAAARLELETGRVSLDADRARAARLEQLLASYPASEPAWVRRLSTWIPRGARLFVGNSLPIREWDLAAARACRPRVFANRGANGIDGLISTFAGVAASDASNWALLGDLSTLYDLAGAWAFRARPNRDVNLVVLNNRGGRIFERMFRNPLFENRHDLEFAGFARQWGLGYLKLDRVADPPANDGPRVIEILPDADETAALWRDWEAG